MGVRAPHLLTVPPQPMPHPDSLPSFRTPWGSSTTPGGATTGDEAAPPVVVPDHVLIRRVGRGSYGEVWLARNALGLHRAVKIVRRSAFDDDRPFEREFAGIQRFEPVSRRHESQLNILHVGRGPGYFYYVMELADDMGGNPVGDEASYSPRSLRSELLLRGRLPVDECIRLGLALTTALEHLHRHGLVHRDVKPSNIVFVNGIPKLADIGLVARAEQTMSFVGTEGYLPPEGPGTVQADLYSLGKVLYEIGTGHDRQQFPELPTGVSELPDRAALAEFNEVLLRACAPDVRQRYASAAEMHADLALLQSGKSVARMRAVERRLRVLGRGGVFVTGMAVLAAAGFFYQQAQTREARRLAGENRALADEKSRLASANASLSEEHREQLVRLRVANGVRLQDAEDDAGALLWFADALPLVAHKPAEDAVHRIRIRQAILRGPRLLWVLAHDANVISGAFSPDGRRVVTATRPGEINVWDAESGIRRLGPVNTGRRIASVQFSPDGKRLGVRSCGEQSFPRDQPDGDGSAEVLDAATGNPVFPPVGNAVHAAFSPDGRWLAVARNDFGIDVLDAATGRQFAALHGHTGPCSMLAFSRDGSRLASAGRDRTARVWRIPSGEPEGEPIRLVREATRVVFSPDGRRLATAATDEGPAHPERLGSGPPVVQTWQVPGGREIGRPLPISGALSALAFDESTGTRLITGDKNPWLNVWDPGHGETVLPPLRFANSVARCWAFGPDGLRLAAGSDDGTARVWDLGTGEPLTPRLLHLGWVESVSFNPDGTRLLTTSDDGTAKLWDLAGGLPEGKSPLTLEGTLPDAPTEYFPHAVGADGSRLLVGSIRGGWIVPVAIGLESMAEEALPPTTAATLNGLVVAGHRGRRWATAGGLLDAPGADHAVVLWQHDGTRWSNLLLDHADPVRGLQFNDDDSLLHTLGNDGMLRSWRTSDGALVREDSLPASYALPAAISRDGRRVSYLDNEGNLHLFSTADTPVAIGPIQTAMNFGAFSPDGTRLATVGPDQRGHLWDPRTGRETVPSFKHGGNLLWIEWSPDGRRLVTAGLAPTAVIWDAATGKPLAGANLGEGALRVAHFSPDGRFVVARNDDRFVRAWDATTGEPVTPLLRHAGNVHAATITSRSRLVTASEPNRIQSWDLRPTELPAAAVAALAQLGAGRRLNPAGGMHTLAAPELAELCAVLRSNQPSLFAIDAADVVRWHRGQIDDLDSLTRVRAAAFHLARLETLRPADPEWTGLRSRIQARRVPERDPATPANALDLSAFYTHSFGILPRGEFAGLPRGWQALGKTSFDLRGIVRLEAGNHAESDRANGRQASASFPLPEATDIPVLRRCRRLHFLQAVDGPRVETGDEVARWRIRFADGSAREFPVVYGEHVEDWWAATDRKQQVRQAIVAWEGKRPEPNAHQTIRLYQSTWENPLPEVAIHHLDFVIGKIGVRPFVVAVTAE